MKAEPTRILLIGQNDTLVNNVRKIIPRLFTVERGHPTVEVILEKIRDFQPDIAILCLDMDVELDVEAYSELSSIGAFDDLAVIVLGQVDECYTFENRVFVRGVHIIQRPVKGTTLAQVLKKCEEDRASYLSGTNKEKPADGVGYQGRRAAGEPKRPLPQGYAPYQATPYDDRQSYAPGEPEQGYERADADYEAASQLPQQGRELEKEIIKIPVSRSNAQKLHSDDVLRVPPEKGRYFRNTVREKQIRRVQTVFEEVDEEAQNAKHPTHISGKFSVLVIDDDVQLLAAVRKYLQNDYFVTTVPSGKMAYRYIEVNVVDVILLDYVMRDEDGPTVLKTLRSNPQTEKIPVIFLTGVSDKERVMNVLSLNPQGYLLKPIQKQELIEAIQKVLE